MQWTPLTAIKTGVVGINQGHWKLYLWLPTFDFPLVVNSIYGHTHTQPAPKPKFSVTSVGGVVLNQWRLTSQSPSKSNTESKHIWGSGAKPPVASGLQGQNPWLGCQGAKPPEADEVVILGTFFAFRLKAATWQIETHVSIIIHKTNRRKVCLAPHHTNNIKQQTQMEGCQKGTNKTTFINFLKKSIVPFRNHTRPSLISTRPNGHKKTFPRPCYGHQETDWWLFCDAPSVSQ